MSKSGAGAQTRTADLLITNQLLYQLSYTGVAQTAGRSISGSLATNQARPRLNNDVYFSGRRRTMTSTPARAAPTGKAGSPLTSIFSALMSVSSPVASLKKW